MHNTSRVEDEPYPRLLGEKGGTGFPTLVFMDENGDVLAKQGARSVKAFETTFKVLDDWQEMRAKFEAGDETVAADLLVMDLQLNRVTFPQAAERRQALDKLSRREERTLDELMAASESSHLLSTLGDEAGPKLVEMYEARRIPTEATGATFFRKILIHARDQKDAKLFQRALVDMKRRYSKDRRLRDYFKEQDATLARLRRGG